MSRKIKFRGKRNKNGEWVFGYYVEDFLSPKDAVIVNTEGEKWFFVNPESVGQFTGLHDKNGKEIYEGDVVKAWKHNETSFVHEIKHRDGIFWFGNWNWSEFQNVFRNIEVIGNIHDNPELLTCE